MSPREVTGAARSGQRKQGNELTLNREIFTPHPSHPELAGEAMQSIMAVADCEGIVTAGTATKFGPRCSRPRRMQLLFLHCDSA